MKRSTLTADHCFELHEHSKLAVYAVLAIVVAGAIGAVLYNNASLIGSFMTEIGSQMVDNPMLLF